jgi:hypothetical protein
LAVFRLAVADYLGIAYSHDGGGPMRRMRGSPFLGEAAIFLASAWAAYLADLIDLQASAIWRNARRIDDRAEVSNVHDPAIAA